MSDPQPAAQAVAQATESAGVSTVAKMTSVIIARILLTNSLYTSRERLVQHA